MRAPLDCTLAPERVLLALRHEPHPFALVGDWAGGGAIVGARPTEHGTGTDFRTLDRLPEPVADVEVGGGWFGWFGYWVGGLIERAPLPPPCPVPMPSAPLDFYDHVLRQDADGRWWFEALRDMPERLEAVHALLAAAPEPEPPPPATFTLHGAGHTAIVADCVERIAAGELLQANLCLRLDARWEGDLAQLFAHAVPALRPRYGACFPQRGVASFSPELFLRRHAEVDVTNAAQLYATFPPASVTGAPKAQAMKVIAALESTAREVYAGAIGFSSPNAGLELNVAIRTFEAAEGRLWLGVGGGIVADSDPAAELEECLVKARPLVSAIGGRIEHQPTRPVRFKAPLASWPRPNVSDGVFETLLIERGVPVNLQAHLARFSNSVENHYGETLPDLDIPRQDGAVRIDYKPGDPVWISTRPLKPRTLPIQLTVHTLPGGLGAHKWRDRSLLDALTGHGTTPLLLDADGTVLEAAWAAVLIRRDGVLYTPRSDGRILPSTSRPQAIEADLQLEPGDELFLSSSLAGVIPAVLAG